MSMKRSWPDSLPSPPPTAIYSPPFHVYNSPQYCYDYPYYRHHSLTNHSLPSRDSATASSGFQYEPHVDLSRPANGVHAVNTSITPDFNVPFDHNNGLYPVEKNHKAHPHITPCTNEPLLTQWILDDFYKMETTERVASPSSFPSPINTPPPVLDNDASPISKKSHTKKKRQQRSGSMDIHCTNCHTSNTPLWRRNGLKQPLCNACGLFLKLHGIIRPLALKTDVIKKRNRKTAEPKHPKNIKKQKQTPSSFWS